jgi:Bifunctional DNA primase/polymerase, N-terminal
MKISENLRELRFVLVKGGTKIAFEPGWQNTANYSIDDARLKEHIDHGGNYGILCAKDVVAFDADVPELIELIEKSDIADTFTQKTGGGGRHYVYHCSDWPKMIAINDKGENLGHVKANGGMIVGAGSVHPNGTLYSIEKDLPVKTITRTQLEKVLEPYIDLKAIEVSDEEKKEIGHQINLTITDIFDPEELGLSQKGDEWQGVHPIHGSTTGQNFSINTAKNVWHCYRDNSGGGVLSAIGLKEKIITCEECVPGRISKQKWKEIFLIAKSKYGLIEHSSEPPTPRPQIVLPGRGRPVGEFASEISAFFTDKDILFFRLADRAVVRLATQSTSIGMDMPVFHEVSATEFITFLEKFFILGIETTDRRSGAQDFVICSLDKNDAAATLASQDQFQDRLPRISKIVSVPIPVRNENGLTFPRRGYDRNFESWMPSDAPDVRTDMPVGEAKEMILRIYREFCFTSEQDRTNAIAALLTPFCRGLYSRTTVRTPVFFYKANRERAGKDYCAGITSIVYEGMAFEDTPISDENETHDDEFRKKILATLKSGRMRIHSSNNKGYLKSSALEGLVTAEFWKDRQLGVTELLGYPNTLEISLSANTGIMYTPDLAARSVFVNLFFAEEDPNARKFETPNLHEWVRQNRGEILSALYALIRNWIEKGSKPGTLSFTSFSEWAATVGGILENAQLGNPCVKNDDIDSIGGDTETRDMKRLYELAYETWGDQYISKKDLISKVTDENSPFNELFGWIEWSKDSAKARMRFGRSLAKFRNRVLGGLRMDIDDHGMHAERNRYRWVKSHAGQESLVS